MDNSSPPPFSLYWCCQKSELRFGSSRPNGSAAAKGIVGSQKRVAPPGGHDLKASMWLRIDWVAMHGSRFHQGLSCRVRWEVG